MEGNLRFKIDRASPFVGSKFTGFALIYFEFEANFPSTSPRGGGGLYRETVFLPALHFSRKIMKRRKCLIVGDLCPAPTPHISRRQHWFSRDIVYCLLFIVLFAISCTKPKKKN